MGYLLPQNYQENRIRRKVEVSHRTSVLRSYPPNMTKIQLNRQVLLVVTPSQEDTIPSLIQQTLSFRTLFKNTWKNIGIHRHVQSDIATILTIRT